MSTTTLNKEQILEEIKNSLTIRRGSLWKHPDFGNRHHELKGVTEKTRRQAEKWDRESLQWMIDLEHLKSVDVSATWGADNRLYVVAECVTATLQPVTFSRWVEVHDV